MSIRDNTAKITIFSQSTKYFNTKKTHRHIGRCAKQYNYEKNESLLLL